MYQRGRELADSANELYLVGERPTFSAGLNVQRVRFMMKRSEECLAEVLKRKRAKKRWM